MRPKTIVAIVLIAVCIVALGYGGITYTTRGESVDLGPMHLTTERTNHIPLPPLLGAVALVGGVVLLIVGQKRFGRTAAR